MLKSRVITAVVLAAIAVALLFLLPSTAFTIVMAAIFLGVGGLEGATLAGLNGVPARIGWIAVLLGGGALAVWATHLEHAVGLLFGAATLLWIVLIPWLMFPDLGRAGAQRFQPLKLTVLGLILLSSFVAISWLHFYSPWRVVFLVLVVAAADIGAFFTGMNVGGPKLAPRISPGKTWSGVGGGLVVAALVAVVAGHWIVDVPFSWLQAAIAALLLALISVCGDLLISLMKRHRNLKDTSSLLPGHGGLLDRIDGLAAAAPIYALMTWLSLTAVQ
ncbi:MAG: phosphatidate cytidylyltransferase [Wenzhouxiangellaceae bacterium]|nr:phosphatidate cytidylyltransferase [Wenzhouxiangellaceae bacterium]